MAGLPPEVIRLLRPGSAALHQPLHLCALHPTGDSCGFLRIPATRGWRVWRVVRVSGSLPHFPHNPRATLPVPQVLRGELLTFMSIFLIFICGFAFTLIVLFPNHPAAGPLPQALAAALPPPPSHDPPLPRGYAWWPPMQRSLSDLCLLPSNSLLHS